MCEIVVDDVCYCLVRFRSRELGGFGVRLESQILCLSSILGECSFGLSCFCWV